MARVQNADRLKEIYENFKPNEIKIIGAYMYAYQDRLPYLKDEYDKDGKTVNLNQVQKLPRYYKNPITRVETPWTIYDRWRMAVATFDVEMKRRPGQKLQFSIADLDADGTVRSGNVAFEDKVLAESKRAWDVIFGPGGLEWGDEKTLAKWADEYEPIMKAYGFKKLDKLKNGKYDIAPFSMNEGEMSDIMNLDDAEPDTMVPETVAEVSTTEEPVSTTPRRGRPPKDKAVVA